MNCLRVVIASLLLATNCHVLLAEGRTWTDRSGKFQTVAEFVSLKDGNVTLKKSNGKTVTLPLERLSDDDQQFAQDLAADQEEAVPAKPADNRGAATTPPRRTNNVINSVRGAVYRNQTLQNVRQIGLALMNYESTRTRFPTQSSNTQSPTGGLSWRVAILPYLEEKQLYDRFHQDEPWDSEHNLQLVEQMPEIFRSPGSDLDDGYTNYVAVVGSNTVISNRGRGTRTQDIRDGTSQTVMVVEADDTHAVIWTQPDDYAIETDAIAEGIGHIWTAQFCAAFADGSVRFLPLSLGSDTIRGLFTSNGGERIDMSQLR